MRQLSRDVILGTPVSLTPLKSSSLEQVRAERDILIPRGEGQQDKCPQEGTTETAAPGGQERLCWSRS
jgi:hypothetical protein